MMEVLCIVYIYIYILTGLVKSTSSSVNNKQSSNAAARSEWVVLDALGMEQMGMGTQRTKEAILFAKYR